VGQERLGPSYFSISLVLGPLNSLVWYVPSLRYTRGLGWRMHCGVEVTESSTNKQHHHRVCVIVYVYFSCGGAGMFFGGGGLLLILGSNLGEVGPDKGLRGEEEGGSVRSGPGAARTILLFHTISTRPSKQPRMVGSTLVV
jgi:hypothetical protein